MKIRKKRRFQVPVRQRWHGFTLAYAWVVLASVGLMLTMVTGGQGAPPPAQVQEIIGNLYPGEREVYDLPNLKRGDAVCLHAAPVGESGPLICHRRLQI